MKNINEFFYEQGMQQQMQSPETENLEKLNKALTCLFGENSFSITR